ncbi:MAG: HAMP domain-containing sensor histidine kinase [Thermoanaerobaculia bacterium]|jgi:signal transduction histidine kinase
MTERLRPHSSVFAKLVAVMLTMTVSLLLLVTGFFIVVLMPTLNRSVEALADDYARNLANSRLTHAEAVEISRRLGIQVRYEGPAGQWSTSDSLPPIAEVRMGAQPWVLGGRSYYLAASPDGGTYLFRWTFRQKTLQAHHALFVLLLVLIGGTIVIAHVVIRRLLRPLRSLGDGVARLSAGELDVALPPVAPDEFGLLTDAFNEMVGRVREMLRARDQLLVDVSHELRSPLTRLRVAIELLPEGHDRARMTSELAEMEAMIAELLELERLSGHGIRLAPTDLAPIIREEAAAFAGRPPGIRIVALADEVQVDADGERIRSVVRNLLENAVKYSLPDSRPVEVSVATDRESIALRIADDGAGVRDEDRAAIFEPFFRADRARSRTPAGYGLGLSICKRIVDAHGGSISSESIGVRGTAFVVTLPARET